MPQVKETTPPDKDKRLHHDRYRAGVWLTPIPEDRIVLDNEPVETDPNEFVVYENYTVPPSPTDQYFEVRPGYQRLDLIARKFYAQPQYYWVIALANDIQEPWEELPVGTVLRIPDIRVLHASGFFEGQYEIYPKE